MAGTKATTGCPLGNMINDAGNDEAAVLGGEEIITILKASMRDCPFLAMAKGIRVFEHQRGVVEVRLK